MATIELAGKTVGDAQEPFIIAEAGCNHNADRDLALRLVDEAAAAAVHAVKFQTYAAPNMYSRQTPMMEHFRKRMNMGPDATMFDLIKATELPYEYHEHIVARAREKGVPFVSTPFDPSDVDFLESFNPPFYKIASFEMTHYPLIERAAATGRPLVLSTGMSTLGDIEKALSVAEHQGNRSIVLLHCVSNYPARPEDYNLRAIETIKRAFGHPVGVSDHTPGIETALIAIAAGAVLVEKHVTLDKSLPGPDHYFSLDPDELRALVSGARRVYAALGSAVKGCTSAEEAMKRIGRRSMVAACDIARGATISREMIAIKRPGTGLHPELMEPLVGCRTRQDIAADTPLSWEMFLQYGENT